MIKFINAVTGNDMWVADDRVEEYTAAGHKLAAAASITKKPENKPEIAPVQPEKRKGRQRSR